MKRKIAIYLIVAILASMWPMEYKITKAASDTGNVYSFTSDNQEVTISFREVKDNDYWYEYYITVTNHSNQSICDWNIEMNCSDVSRYSKAFKCSVTKDTSQGTLTVKGSGNNKVVAAGSSISSNEGVKLGFGSSVQFSNPRITYSYGTQSSVGDVSGGVGYSNTYLEGYQCNYALTGEPQNMAWQDTPVGKHGKLHVDGTQLTDEHNQPTILRGASTHGMHWGEMTPFVNKAAFQNLRDEWGVDMVRLVSYVTQGGYTEGAQNTLDTAIQNGVSYAEELGMYAIIDWHIHNENPNTTKDQAVEFFKKYSALYKDKEHVIYEICNEPTGTPWSQIKPYAEEVIAAIRANDKDAIIIVGTNTWSQDVDEVATNGGKINDPNVMYTIHFYSGTHGQSLRDKVSTALRAGTPVFCTEFGICDASGNGGFNVDEANEWIDCFEENGISYSCWSLCNKDESASMISPQSQKKSGWTKEDLGATGAWLINTYRSKRGEEPSAVPTETPGTTVAPETTPEVPGTTVTPDVPESTPEVPGTTVTPVIPESTPQVPEVTPGNTPEQPVVSSIPSTPNATRIPGQTFDPATTTLPNTTMEPAVGGTWQSALTEEEFAQNSAMLDTKAKVMAKKKKLVVTWGKVVGATSYVVYVKKCGAKKDSLATTVSGNKGKVAIKKLNGKKIKPGVIYEVTVRAYREGNGENQQIAKSTTLHVAGTKHKKYTNVKKITPKKKIFTLKKGKSKRVKSKIVKQTKKKKLLTVKHAAKLRYKSSNTQIATVSKKGKVKAKRRGKCVISIIAPNGVSAKVNVKVK